MFALTIRLIGVALMVLAIAIYFVAVFAMNHFELRRRLPYKSPFELWGRGCFCFYLGAALMVVSAMLNS